METRDQWYKPNLLYNIHYRPPKKPEPPKMIVETVQFNPSVCTCGEHGCQPKYRMEKRVLWTNKEVCNAEAQAMVRDGEKKNEYRERKTEERNAGSVRTEREKMELNRMNNQDIGVMIEGDGNRCGPAESFKGKMSGDVEVNSGYWADYAVKIEENLEIDDDNDDENEEKKEEFVFKNEVGHSKSKGDICIDEEASSTNNTEEKNSNGIKDGDYSDVRTSEGVYGEKRIGNDSKGAFNNDCKLGEKSFKEDQIDRVQAIDEGDGAVDRNSAGDVGGHCSENRPHINDSNESARSLESANEGLEDVEIASAFGILSVYCNSELHSWMTFEEENVTKKMQ